MVVPSCTPQIIGAVPSNVDGFNDTEGMKIIVKKYIDLITKGFFLRNKLNTLVL